MTAAGALQSWRSAARTFDDPQGAITWWADGDGAPLLLLHGFPTSSWDWRRLWPSLAPRRRVVALDFLGFGLSAKPRDGDYRVAAQADRVERLCAHLEITAADVVAHDLGGLVAQELLARQGEGAAAVRIESVVFLSIGLDLRAHRKAERRLAGPLASRGGFARALAREFERAFRPSAAEIEETLALLRENRGHRLAGPLMRYGSERKLQRDRWAGAVAARIAPERFVFGAPSLAAGVAAARAVRSRMPDADVVLMEGVGRYPHLEAPDAVLEAVESFHAAHAARARARVA